MLIQNTVVSGLDEAIVASGFPMREANLHDWSVQPEDVTRAERLAQTEIGTGHDCYLVGITVSATVTAPRYWWPEMQRYHFMDIVSATSTMHTLQRILKRIKGQLPLMDEEWERIRDAYFCEHTSTDAVKRFFSTMDEYADMDTLKANLPEGFLQTARVVTNYRQLKTIYRQRRNHRLRDWKEFIAWIEHLPKHELITGK